MSDIAKHNAAVAALEHVRPGMILGLGTGSTASIFVRLLAGRVAAGLDVRGVPTSEATHCLAQDLGVVCLSPDEAFRIDLTVDGADEFDPELRLVKGGGAALLREKIIAEASDRMIVITDAGKEVARLGRFALPIEINPFGAELTRRRIHALIGTVGLAEAQSAWRLTGHGERLTTDGGHHILDLSCGVIPDPDGLAVVLDRVPGVVEHGLFIGLADLIIVGEIAGARTLARV